jgi:hypothetical protein
MKQEAAVAVGIAQAELVAAIETATEVVSTMLNMELVRGEVFVKKEEGTPASRVVSPPGWYGAQHSHVDLWPEFPNPRFQEPEMDGGPLQLGRRTDVRSGLYRAQSGQAESPAGVPDSARAQPVNRFPRIQI